MRERKPVITLLTDFGVQDYFVGAMKGVIVSSVPGAEIIDITHEIPPQDIQTAAFNLLASYKTFPKKTIHVAVVDPGVGSLRRAIAVTCAEQFFVGPDNGLFSWICQREGEYRAINLTKDEFFRRPVSNTFHGRDIFAPVAAALCSGVRIDELGEPIDNLVQLEPLMPKRSAGVVEGRVIQIDRFGNCITNFTTEISGQDFHRAKLIVGDREVNSFRRYFSDGDGREGDIFCVRGSAGFLEIVAANDSAERILNARRGQTVQLIIERSHE